MLLLNQGIALLVKHVGGTDVCKFKRLSEFRIMQMQFSWSWWSGCKYCFVNCGYSFYTIQFQVQEIVFKNSAKRFGAFTMTVAR